MLGSPVACKSMLWFFSRSIHTPCNRSTVAESWQCGSPGNLRRNDWLIPNKSPVFDNDSPEPSLLRAKVTWSVTDSGFPFEQVKFDCLALRSPFTREQMRLDVFLDVLKKDSNFFDSKKGPKSGDKANSHPSDFRIIMDQNVQKNNKLMGMFWSNLPNERIFCL
uniref:Uncharacterized protein n=1 Tax=Populus alba TaxID=43335 RepID=A0A4U5QZN7_POPAL|nr:hypothetical protein D5086_0000016740 [Populus alba]